MRSNRPPLVSCIMPTYNRRPFVRQAIAYFLRQTYPERELIVLDDGSDPVGDLASGDPRIRYVRVPPGNSLGAKRNLACREARGEYIVHWDDDDWSAPRRLQVQVEALHEGGADVCGVDLPIFYEPAADLSWQYKQPNRGWKWVCGATLGYRRTLWECQPFRNFRIGEDDRFVKAARETRVVALADGEVYVGLIHPGNTSAKETHTQRWRNVPDERARGLLGEDLAFYRELAGTRTPMPREPSAPVKRASDTGR